MEIKNYRDLTVWQKAIDLVVFCYELTEVFPKSEKFGLVSQMQRAAISIPSNIAEGRQRQHPKEFLQHLFIALGSLAELETQVEIANRLGYINEAQSRDFFLKSTEIGKMIYGLKRAIES